MAGRVLAQPPPGFVPGPQPATFVAPSSPPPSRPPAGAARAQAPAAPAAPRPPVIRTQGPDDLLPPPPPPRSAPAAAPREFVVLPPPEQLGVAARAADAGLDWTVVDRRLQALGAVCFQMNRLPQDRWRITCLLPTAQADHTHCVEAEADTKADAVRAVLEQAEKWAGRSK